MTRLSSADVPVSSGERYTTLFPDDMWFWTATNLTFKHHTASFHQFLDGWHPDEEGNGSRSLSPAHLRHCFLFSDAGKTNGIVKPMEEHLEETFSGFWTDPHTVRAAEAKRLCLSVKHGGQKWVPVPFNKA